MKRTLSARDGQRWSVIDAGRRVQVGSQATDIRHFRVSGDGVKRGSGSRQAMGRADAELDFPGPVVGSPRADGPIPAGGRPNWPNLPGRPLLVGDRDYLRALRAAEMTAWQASGGDALNFIP